MDIYCSYQDEQNARCCLPKVRNGNRSTGWFADSGTKHEDEVHAVVTVPLSLTGGSKSSAECSCSEVAEGGVGRGPSSLVSVCFSAVASQDRRDMVY